MMGSEPGDSCGRGQGQSRAAHQGAGGGGSDSEGKKGGQTHPDRGERGQTLDQKTARTLGWTGKVKRILIGRGRGGGVFG